MTPHDLLTNFETLADAPNGVQRLRELVLELAVRGKLVEQEFGDEPAADLMKRVLALRTRQLQTERGKAAKPSTFQPGEKTPIAIPNGWAWARLDELTTKVGSGKTPLGGRSVYASQGIKFLRSQNVWDDGLRLSDVAFIDAQTHASMATTCVRPKDLLFNITGASIGRCAIVPDDFDEGNVSQHVCIVRLADPDLRGFVHLALTSNLIQSEVMNVQVGISREGLSTGRFKEFLIPIPPLAEQRRIVARVDELMALLDRLDAKRQEREAARTAARDSALASLREAPTPDDVETAWLRIQERFHELFATPEDVEPLRALVLEMAVRGKLVEQDSDEEPAEALMASLRKEKAKLVREGRIRAGRALAESKREDCPFAVPKGWAVCRMTDLGFFLGGKTPSTNVGAYWDGAIPWVSPKDMKVPLIEDTEDHVSHKAIEDGLPSIPKGSVLIVVRSGILRRMVPVAITLRDSTINQDLKALWPFPSAKADYIALMIKGFEGHILEHLTKTGTTVESMKFEEFSTHPFLLPPEKEQRRIVARVDELMALLDRLSQALETHSNLAAKFAAAAVHHLEV